MLLNRANEYRHSRESGNPAVINQDNNPIAEAFLGSRFRGNDD